MFIKTEYRGEWLTLFSFLLWGIAPLYFQQLGELPVPIIFASRILMTLPLLVIALLFLKGRTLRLPKPAQAGWALLGAVLVSTSWLGNLWGAVNGQLLAVSLAFFLSPLLTIAISMVIFQERFSKRQMISFAICTLAFVFYCFANGALPWLTLVIAIAFALYGVVKRKGQVSELGGLTAEVLLMLPVSLWILGGSAFGASGFNGSESTNIDLITSNHWLWLIAPVYYLPLMLYGIGVRSIRQMSTAGMMTYVEPVIMYALALTVFNEPVSPMKQMAMLMVWGGILLQFPFGVFMMKRRSALS